MNSIAIVNTAPRQLTITARAVAAILAVAFLSAAWLSAGKASHEAVATSVGALNTTRVTLQTVEIVGQRSLAPTMTAQAVSRNAI